MGEPKPLVLKHISHQFYADVKGEDVLSAVEGLKKDVEDIYHKLGKVPVWSSSQDVVCDMAEDYFKKCIDKWFQLKEGK